MLQVIVIVRCFSFKVKTLSLLNRIFLNFAEGYAKVNDILNDRRFQDAVGRIGFEDIKHIVDTNDKKRFEMKEVDSEFYIKATQGHTVQVNKSSSTLLI